MLQRTDAIKAVGEEPFSQATEGQWSSVVSNDRAV